MHALDKSTFHNKLSRKQFAMCIAHEALKHSYHTAYYSRLLTANTPNYLAYRAYLRCCLRYRLSPAPSASHFRLIRSSNKITGSGLTRYRRARSRRWKISSNIPLRRRAHLILPRRGIDVSVLTNKFRAQ